MRNRWYHVPLWHTRFGEKKPTWLELFYDLIFVAVFIQLGNNLSSVVTLHTFWNFCSTFTPLWLVWTGFTYFINRYTVDDFVQRLLTFLKMFAVGGMGVTAAAINNGSYTAYAATASVAHLALAAMYLRASIQQPTGSDYGKYWGFVFALAGSLWALVALLPQPFDAPLAGLAVLILLLAPYTPQSRKSMAAYPQDEEHITERFGLLTIIVLGESFVNVLSSISGYADISMIGRACLGLTLTCCVWWTYFDDVADSKVKSWPHAPMVWLYGHLPFQLGITVLGVAITKAVTLDFSIPAPSAYRWLICGSLAIVFLSAALLDHATEGRQAELSDRMRVTVRCLSALLILLLGAVGQVFSAGALIGYVVSVCVIQVFFDMVMAPLEDKHPITTQSVAEITRQSAVTGTNARMYSSGAVIKGAPSHLRKDLYFFLMDGSWLKVFLTLALLYLVINTIFAALYLLQPGSIQGARPDSFADTFYFSIQTMATIGYGVLSPKTTYGNILVVIQAAFGILGVALATGLMFAKASKPRSSILFSQNMVVTYFDGAPVLGLRVGNARGNDLLEASISLSALFDRISIEGHHLRKIIDLKLIRNRTPFFALSWSVMHPIDADSPLQSLLHTGEQKDLIGIVVSLMGHDGTYGQTVYSRYRYEPDQILTNRHFGDILSQLPDGKMMIDYAHFHQTYPDNDPKIPQKPQPDSENK